MVVFQFNDVEWCFFLKPVTDDDDDDDVVVDDDDDDDDRLFSDYQ